MAKVYFEKLSQLADKLKLNNETDLNIEIKHFFSGAALYINHSICVSWSPVGLAFRLPDDKVHSLIKNGKAIPLKYFPNGHVKKGYALFENPDSEKPECWKKHFKESIEQVRIEK
jgi:hypothetical protein